MSDVKHTPGPWQRFSTSPESVADILKMFSGAQKLLVVGKTTEHPAPSAVALVFIPQHEGDPKPRVDEFFANNALIAAAPDLLAACGKAEKSFRDYAELHRAKGTTDGNRKAVANEKLADEMRAAITKAEGEKNT